MKFLNFHCRKTSRLSPVSVPSFRRPVSFVPGFPVFPQVGARVLLSGSSTVGELHENIGAYRFARLTFCFDGIRSTVRPLAVDGSRLE